MGQNTQQSVTLIGRGNRRVGAGHLMRLFALARWLQKAEISVSLLTDSIDDWLVDVYETNGIPVRQVADLATFLRREWAVDATELCAVDGYEFTAEDLKLLRPSRRIWIHDFSRSTLAEFSVKPTLNDDLPDEGYLPGPAFVLTRPELLEIRRGGPDSQPATPGRLLVLTGGGHFPQLVSLFGHACQYLPQPMHIKFVGGSVAEENTLQVGRCTFETMRPRWPLEPLLAWADAAVVAAGVTTYELAVVGVPMAVGVMVDNQAPIAAAFRERKLAGWIGDFREMEATELAQRIRRFLDRMDLARKRAARAQQFLDGYGALRVLDRILEFDAAVQEIAVDAARRYLAEWRMLADRRLRPAAEETQWVDATLDAQPDDARYFLACYGRIPAILVVTRRAGDGYVHLRCGVAPYLWGTRQVADVFARLLNHTFRSLRIDQAVMRTGSSRAVLRYLKACGLSVSPHPEEAHTWLIRLPADAT